MYKTLKKIVATALIAVITFSYLQIIGVCVSNVYATDSKLENQGTTTNNSNVEFDAYFKVDENNVHSATKTISENNLMYAKINVKDAGYLKESQIEITGPSNKSANFSVLEIENEICQSVTENKIKLNSIENGSEVILEIPIIFVQGTKIDADSFLKQNEVKLTGTYVDANGDIKKIQKTIKLELQWKDEPEIQIEQEVTRYIPYTIEDEKGIILQTLVKTGVKDNKLPIKQTNVEVLVPSINGKKPTEIKVIANTLATNGMQKTLSDKEYEYNEETGKIEILTENPIQEDGKINWNKQVQDEYLITYIYKEETTVSENLKVELGSKAEIQVYGNEQKTISNEVPKTEITLNERIGNIVTVQNTATQSLSKGFLYANTKAVDGEKQETVYTQKVSANVSYSDVVDKLSVTLETDKFVVNDDSVENISKRTYIKDIYINRDNYINLLGEEGTITILSKEGATIDIITNKSKVDNNGNIVVDLNQMNLDQIVIKTSKPQKEGTIDIYVDKAVKESANLLNIQNYKAIRTDAKTEAIKQSNTIVEERASTDIVLVEPVSKIDMQLSTTNLSTIVENKNVELKAILDTSNSNYALYKNPVIDFVLPEYVENITINSVTSRFNDELQVANYEVISQRIIRVTMSGEQTKYDIGLMARGLNIIVNANITTKKLTPSIQSEVKMYVYNENSNIYENVEDGRGVVTLPIQFIAPAGIVAASSISNYNSQNDQMLLISGEGKRGSLDVLRESRLATVENIIINNSTSPINNVSILGRTISKGNKNIQTGEDLGTTFDASMRTLISVEGIDSSKVTIYYSENGAATKDLTNPENGWTTQVQDLAKVKSYLVVLNDSQMEVGTIISLKYNMEIPELLSRNQYGYATYAVYYSNALTRSVSEEKLIAPLTEVSTGEGPEIETKLEANVEDGEEVQEGQIIKYTVTITNTGKALAQSVIAGANIPAGTKYIEYVAGIDGQQDVYKENETKTMATKALGDIEPGKSATFEFEVKVSELEVYDDDEHVDENGKPLKKEVTVKASAYGTALELDALAGSNEISNKVVEGYLTTSMVTNPGISTVLKGGNTLIYKVNLKNINESALKNVVAKDVLPEGLKYKQAYYYKNMAKLTNNIRYDETSREITYSIGELAENEIIELYLEVEVDNTKYEITQIKNSMQISCVTSDNQTRTFRTNEIVNSAKIDKAELKATLTSDIPTGNIEEGEIIKYIFELTNTGTKTMYNVKIIDVFPPELTYVNSSYEIDGIESEIGGSTGSTAPFVASLEAGKTLKYILTLEVNELPDGVERMGISNKFNVYSEELGMITTNIINHTVVPKAEIPNNPEEPDGPTTETRKIQGQIWLDENRDGKKDEAEARQSNIEVMLYSYATGKLVTDEEGKIISIKTDESGRYEFSDLSLGEYSVIFLYDTSKYSSTIYRKEGVDNILNSDAIDSKITLDGAEKVAALTEKVDVTDSNMYNVDLGLVENKKFDLKLEKTVASITVQNQTGTAKYDYNNQFAKRDLTGRYLEDTTIVVEYKIAITNEGAIEGYAKKIVDYIPSNFKFNAELNKDWYTLDNGSICSSSLANTKILPGETKQITLLLTKSVKESDLTIISNTAEILEAYNDLGIADVDSTPGNKQSNEDDISKADILLTIRTGAQTIMFLILTLGIISVIGIGVYFINKKVIRRIR